MKEEVKQIINNLGEDNTLSMRKIRLAKFEKNGLFILALMWLLAIIGAIVSFYIAIWGDTSLGIKLTFTFVGLFLIISGARFLFVEGVKQVKTEINGKLISELKPTVPSENKKSAFRQRLDDAMEKAHESNKNINP